MTPSRLDVSALAPEHQRVFNQVATEEFCGCKSSRSLASCLERNPSCRLADHLADFIVTQAQAGFNSDDILGLLSHLVLGPFCAQPKKVSVPRLPWKGASGATLEVIEFADFKCPHCKQQAVALRKMFRKWSDRIRFQFVPFPLRDHPESVAAAEALLAAHEQGKYWEMHDQLFEQQGHNLC